MGRDYPGGRMAPAAAFAGAPRLHGGLAPGEFPAILERGEAVFTKNQVKALAGSGRTGMRVVNNINIAAPDGSVSSQTLNQVQAALAASMARAARRNN